MATQIEHLENHTARLKVDVPPAQLDKAMQGAARRISRKVNIPGFRKGKAPYNLIVKYVGAQAVLEEAIEELSQVLYRAALDEAKIEPYAPGTLENIETEPNVQLTFVVAKQPETDLGSYRDVRVPFQAVEVEDSAVTEAVKRMLDQDALVEPTERAAQLSDLVKMKVLAEVVHAHGHAEAHDETEAHDPAEAHLEEAHTDAETEDAHTEEVEPYIDEELEEVLTENAKEDLVPGYSANIVGMTAGEEKMFSLVLPEDFDQQEYANHTVNFKVTVQEVKSRTLPTLNDEFAKKVTNGEAETLLDLRIRTRKELQEFATRDAESHFADEVMDKILEGATIKYPEEMVEQYTTDILETLDRNLRQRGLSLDDFKRIENKDDAAIRLDYRDAAIKRLMRTLALTEIIKLEHVYVTDEQIDEKVKTLSARFGDQTSIFQEMLMRPENRRNIAMDLITEQALARLVAIGKGENPPIAELPTQLDELAAVAEPAASPVPAIAATTPATEITPIEAHTETDSGAEPTAEISAEINAEPSVEPSAEPKTE